MQTFLGSSRFPPHKSLFNGPVTSVHWRLVFVSKEPIRCSVNVDTSVVCHVLMDCLDSFMLLLRGKMWKIRIFREMLLTCI